MPSHLLTALLLLALCAACDLGTAPSETQAALGTYALRSIDGRPLPTLAPCGAFEVREAEIRLRSRRRAEYRARYVSRGDGAEVTFSGTGSFQRDDGQVVLSLRGRWSNSTSPDPVTSRLHLEGSPGVLLRHGVGAECDASSVERFELQ